LPDASNGQPASQLQLQLQLQLHCCPPPAATLFAIRCKPFGTHQGGATGEAGDADDFSGAAGL